LLHDDRFVAGPDLAVPTASGCLSRASWSQEEFIIIGGVTASYYTLNNAQVQHFSNGSWKLIPEAALGTI